MAELQLLWALAAMVRARLAALHRGERGALSLEVVAIAIVLVLVAGVLLAILRAKVTAGADRIQLPGS